MEVTWIVTAAVVGMLVFGALGYILCLVLIRKRADGNFVIDRTNKDGMAGVYLERFFPNYEQLMNKKFVVFRVINNLKEESSKN